MSDRMNDIGNRFIAEADNIYNYLSDSYKNSLEKKKLRQEGRVIRFGPMRYMRIKQYRKNTGYIETVEAFKRVTEDALNSFHAAGCSFGAIVLNENGNVRFYYGEGGIRDNCNVRIETVLRDIPDMKCENSFPSPEELSRKMRHCAILTGVPDSKASLADVIADCVEPENAVVAVLATPVNRTEAESYLNKLYDIQSMCESYGVVERTYGNASRQIIKDTIPSVARLKKYTEKQIERLRGKESSFWQYCVIIGAQNEQALNNIGNTISGYINSGEPGVGSYWFRLVDGMDLLWSVPAEQYSELAALVDRSLQIPTLTSYILSSELSEITHLPVKEHAGLAMKDYVPSGTERNPFSVNPPEIRGSRIIDIGKVSGSGHRYCFSADLLRRHMLVVGSNGSGKTTTIKSILKQVSEYGINFCVIEPDKTHYWQLVADIPEMRVLTSAKTGERLHINILEPEIGTTIGAHISNINGILAAIIDMEEATKAAFIGIMEYTFKRCGWRTNDTYYGPVSGKRMPTIQDLHDNLSEYCASNLRHDSEVRHNIEGTVENRLRHLCAGDAAEILLKGKGITGEELCSKPTVIELDSLSEMSRNVISAFLIEKIYRYIKTQGFSEDRVKNIIVVEEAHNIFRRESGIVNSVNATTAYLNEMLNAIRAYGTGLIIADQRTSVIDLNAVANTHIKIVHSLQSADDLDPLMMALDLNETRKAAIRRLGVGEAVVASSESSPCLVTIDNNKSNTLKSSACALCFYRSRCFYEKIKGKLEEHEDSLRGVSAQIITNRYRPPVMTHIADTFFNSIKLMGSYRACALGYMIDKANNSNYTETREIVYNYCTCKDKK